MQLTFILNQDYYGHNLWSFLTCLDPTLCRESLVVVKTNVVFSTKTSAVLSFFNHKKGVYKHVLVCPNLF